MSTDFHLAPAQTPSGAAPAAPVPQQPAHPQPAAPRTAPAPQRTGKQSPDTSEGTVAGAVIPGAVLSSLIGLCWMIHQFGLPIVILGIMAAAAAAATALALKGRKGRRKVRDARTNALKSTGGGGPGRTVLDRPGKPRNGGGGGGGGSSRDGRAKHRDGGVTRHTGNRHAPVGPSRKRDGAPGPSVPQRKTPHTPASGTVTPKQPGGPGKTLKNGTRKDKTLAPGNTNEPRRTRPGGLGSGLTPKSRKDTTAPRRDSAVKDRTPRKAPGPDRRRDKPGSNQRKPCAPATGKAGLLKRLRNRKNTPATDLKGPAKTLTPATKLAKKLAKAARDNTRTTPRAPRPDQLKTKTAKPLSPKKAAKGKKPKLRKHKPTAHMSRARRLSYLAGVKLRKHTSKKTRLRIRKATSPLHTAARTTSRYLSPLLAHACRRGTRAFLTAHLRLGTVRYTAGGPNWARPLAKVLHVLGTPLARTLAATGSWGWLNRWMYRHTSGPTAEDRLNTPPTTTAPQPGPAETSPDRPHTPVTLAPTGAFAAMSEAAAPLEQAVEAIRQAGAMLLTDPSENMIGYEAILRTLALLQAEIGNVFHSAAESTRENFKVNPAVPEAYDDTAGYALQLADRLEEIPSLYRQLHADQVENIENPTVQARKWDISANE
ncbi:hypothetical protein [Streptomyces sp. DH12]|uniref:hypothetical protein n=1 Tax=Streptomyces sp. DH12 TaxID=2857010 RepID=UPI001E46DAD4|nr:hypothetical protein [Streptomyces sp. DH12]